MTTLAIYYITDWIISSTLSCLLLGCSDSPTDIENTTNLITRVWKGESFSAVTIEDTLFLARDLITQLEFKKDGNYHVSRASNSTMTGRNGTWSLDGNGQRVKMFLGATHVEELPIILLSNTRLVLGDTTTHGYSLVPF